MKRFHISPQRPGAVALLTILGIMTVVMIVMISVSTAATSGFQSTQSTTSSQATFAAAEGAMQQVLYGLRNDSNYVPPDPINVGSLPIPVSVTITGSSFPKTITATASGPQNTIRSLRVQVHASSLGGINGAVLAGSGGFQLTSNSGVVNDSTGQICSQGNITGTGKIFGNVGLASGANIDAGIIQSPYILKTNEPCPFPPLPNYFFTKNPLDPHWNDSLFNQAQGGGNFSAVVVGDNEVHISKGVYPSITITGHGTIFIDSGPIWVTGSLIATNPNATITLDPANFSSGQSSALIAEGTISLKNGGALTGITYTGTPTPPSSYLFVSSLSTSDIAVEPANNNMAALYYAPNGTISISTNGVTLSNATAKAITMKNDTITYDAGLRDLLFKDDTTPIITPVSNSLCEVGMPGC